MTEICPDCGRPQTANFQRWKANPRELCGVPARSDQAELGCLEMTVHKLRDELVALRAQVAPLTRLEAWARKDEARYFEIRFIAESPHPWAVELNNDEFGWSAVADCHDELEEATDHAFGLAMVEEAKDRP